MTTTIIVSGPGGCINFEVEIIKRALEAYGVTVTIENDAPEVTDGFIEEIARRLNGDWSEGNPNNLKDEYNLGAIKKEVHIKVDHIPWGG